MSEPFDEQRLRRALRLDADERPPRLDAAALRAAAEGRAEGAPSELVIGGTLLAGAALVASGALFEAAELVLAILAAPPADPLDAAVALALAAVLPFARLLSTLAQPSVALGALATLVAVTAYELVERRMTRAPTT